MKNAQSLYKLNKRNVVGMLIVDIVQNTWQVTGEILLHYERKEMDQSPSEMMIKTKSLEKGQSELGKRMKR
jgi:hypothetical protein